MAAAPPPLAEALGRAIAAHQVGDLAGAETIYKAILAREPRQFDALHLMGLIAAQRGDLAAARRLIGEAIKVHPRSADAHVHLGNVFLALDRPKDAAKCFERALAIEPADADALNNFGTALRKLGRAVAALGAYDRALAIRPDHVEALNNRGIALQELGRPAEALASYERALALKSDHAEALNNRGTALSDLGRDAEALASFDRALAVRPGVAGVLNNRANALTALGRYAEAIPVFAEVLRLDPASHETKGLLLRAKLLCCDWSGYAEAVNAIVADIRAGRRSDQPFSFAAISDSPRDQKRCAEIFVRERWPGAAPPKWRPRRRGGRIRLAYLSADFYQHAVPSLIAGVFERHDRARFETIAISFSPDRDSPMRRRLEAAFERFVELRRKTNREIAAAARALEVDIAVDLMGFTNDVRRAVMAERPAPVQVNYLGYPGTMGADYIDYIIADRIVIPEADRAHYSEKVIYLPDCYQPNDDRRAIAAETPSRDAAGLPPQGFVFCSFNNTYKIAPAVFAVWMRLLRNVPASVLWLLAGDEAAARNLCTAAADMGVAPERIVFAPKAPPAEHLARQRLADLFLDTLPYNAHTTASDALWAGLPVLTCIGTTFAGRVAASLLTAAGLPETIAHSLGDYEAMAMQLANDPAALKRLKGKLDASHDTCALFDTDRHRRHLESAFERIWERHRQGKPPVGFAVAPVD